MSKYKVGAYIRLSRDDKYSESDSIENQRIIIDQYINEHDDFEIVDYYIDNGFVVLILIDLSLYNYILI